MTDDEIKNQKLLSLVTKANAVVYAEWNNLPIEEQVAAMNLSKEDAALMSELVAGTQEAMKELAPHAKKFLALTDVEMDRIIALSSLPLKAIQRRGSTKEQKAILKEYGFKSEGLIANALSFGFNKRANASLLPQIQKQQKESRDKIHADYNAAARKYIKDVNAVHTRIKNKLSV